MVSLSIASRPGPEGAKQALTSHYHLLCSVGCYEFLWMVA